VPIKKHTMPCLLCGTPTEAKDTRSTGVGGYAATKRRRVCPACGDRFVSYEIPATLLRRHSALGHGREELVLGLAALEAALSDLRAKLQ